MTCFSIPVTQKDKNRLNRCVNFQEKKKRKQTKKNHCRLIIGWLGRFNRCWNGWKKRNNKNKANRCNTVSSPRQLVTWQVASNYYTKLADSTTISFRQAGRANDEQHLWWSCTVPPVKIIRRCPMWNVRSTPDRNNKRDGCLARMTHGDVPTIQTRTRKTGEHPEGDCPANIYIPVGHCTPPGLFLQQQQPKKINFLVMLCYFFSRTTRPVLSCSFSTSKQVTHDKSGCVKMWSLTSTTLPTVRNDQPFFKLFSN